MKFFTKSCMKYYTKNLHENLYKKLHDKLHEKLHGMWALREAMNFEAYTYIIIKFLHSIFWIKVEEKKIVTEVKKFNADTIAECEYWILSKSHVCKLYKQYAKKNSVVLK